MPFHAEDLVFQFQQPAAFQAQLPQPPRAEQQVQVLQPIEGVVRARHAEPRFEQRLIVGFAVVGDQHVELGEVLGGYFVASFLAYKRNEIERFERYVTDWEFREYAYHL